MIENLYLMRREGGLVYQQHVSGRKLDADVVVGFFANMSIFTSRLLGTLTTVSLDSCHFDYREVGKFVIVVNSSSDASRSVVGSQMEDLHSLLEMFFGSPDEWDEDSLQLGGFKDVIEALFHQIESSPSALVEGVDTIVVESETRAALERGLASLEEDHEAIRGTMMVLGNSVLRTRLHNVITRLLLLFVRARPLDGIEHRCVPLYVAGVWRSLMICNLQSFKLILVTQFGFPYDQLKPIVQNFESTLIDKGVDIPVEEPPILIRHYASRDVVFFVYHNLKTGVALTPQQRPAPAIEQEFTYQSFNWFFSHASALLASSSMVEVALQKDGLRYFARRDGPHELHLLCPDSIKPDILLSLWEDIVAKIQVRTPQF